MIALFATLALVADSGPAFAAKPAQSPSGTTPAVVRLVRPASCDGFALLAKSSGPAKLSKLGDLPDANMEIAVSRTFGCQTFPVVVRYNVTR